MKSSEVLREEIAGVYYYETRIIYKTSWKHIQCMSFTGTVKLDLIIFRLQILLEALKKQKNETFALVEIVLNNWKIVLIYYYPLYNGM